MYKGTTMILNKSGLHMRPATEFIAMAGKFASDITIGRVGAGERGNAKSIVMLLKMGLSMGTEVEITAEGPDERQAVDALIDLIKSGMNDL